MPSSSYRFMVILSPVGAYYEEGLNPVSIYVEPNYVRLYGAAQALPKQLATTLEACWHRKRSS